MSNSSAAIKMNMGHILEKQFIIVEEIINSNDIFYSHIVKEQILYSFDFMSMILFISSHIDENNYSD